jgi:hypothetical protein
MGLESAVMAETLLCLKCASRCFPIVFLGNQTDGQIFFFSDDGGFLFVVNAI